MRLDRPYNLLSTFTDSGEGGGGQTPDPALTPTPPAPPAPPATDEKLGESGIKALQAERDARKAAEDQLKALRQQIEDASKTAEQKAADDLAAARKAATESAARALRYEVAASKGLDLKLAPRLTGTTQEELEADADALKALLGTPAPKNPKPDPSAGAGGDVKTKTIQDAISAHYASR